LVDVSSLPDYQDIGFVGARHREAADDERHRSSNLSITIPRSTFCKLLRSCQKKRFAAVASRRGLNKDVEYNPVLIDGAPETVLHALDPGRTLRPCECVSRLRLAATHTVGESRSEFLAPVPHRLIGDDNTALRQKQLDTAQTEAEDVVQPNDVSDDLGGAPMTIVCVG
jgi:hypothetical protein